MAVTSERRYTVICDSCGDGYYDPDSGSAMGARITAAVKGWRYVHDPRRQGGRGDPVRRSFDFCPACEPKLPDLLE